MTDPFFFRHRHDQLILIVLAIAIAALLWWIL
jgi:hypothetical protein